MISDPQTMYHSCGLFLSHWGLMEMEWVFTRFFLELRFFILIETMSLFSLSISILLYFLYFFIFIIILFCLTYFMNFCILFCTRRKILKSGCDSGYCNRREIDRIKKSILIQMKCISLVLLILCKLGSCLLIASQDSFTIFTRDSTACNIFFIRLYTFLNSTD